MPSEETGAPYRWGGEEDPWGVLIFHEDSNGHATPTAPKKWKPKEKPKTEAELYPWRYRAYLLLLVTLLVVSFLIVLFGAELFTI
jgi:hypothetical protein